MEKGSGSALRRASPEEVMKGPAVRATKVEKALALCSGHLRDNKYTS